MLLKNIIEIFLLIQLSFAIPENEKIYPNFHQWSEKLFTSKKYNNVWEFSLAGLSLETEYPDSISLTRNIRDLVKFGEYKVKFN